MPVHSNILSCNRWLSAGVLLVVFLQPVRTRAAEPFQLVQKAEGWGIYPETVVVTRENASYLERSAADEFVQYVHRANKPSILLERAAGGLPANWKGSAVFVGVAGRPPFGDVDPAKLPKHGFRIRAAGKRMDVIGQSEQGASNALYWLLWEKVGVRWYIPTRLGEEIPVHDGISIGAMDVTLGPDFPVYATFDARNYGSGGNRTREGQSRDTMTRHIWSEIVPPSDENKLKHPEWFALTDVEETPGERLLDHLWKDGKGQIRGGQVCTTNPEVLKMFVARARTFFRENPDCAMFSVESNDYGDFCVCERCKELDAKLGNGPLMNRLISFYNQIAAELKEEFPDKQLGFYAYADHVAPPTAVKPDPMLVPLLCFFGSPACYQHAINDASCPVNAAWRKNVFDPWVKLCPKFGYYSYYAYSSAWQGPQMMVKTLPEDLKFIAKHGGFSFHVDGWTNWATCAPMYYLLRRLPWDVDADPQALLDDWYRGMYGPAAEPMQKFWEALTEGYYQGGHRPSGPRNPEKLFTADILQKAGGFLAEAEKIARDAAPRYGQRIAIARAGFDYTDFMAAGYRFADHENWKDAIASGKQALQVIVDSRRLEGAPYVKPMWPREEHAWIWFRTWDGKNSSEIRTESVIKGWEEKRAGSDKGAGELVVRLPDEWSFRMDQKNEGEEQEWFKAPGPADDWKPVSVRRPWTSQEFPGPYHGTGWYRVSVPFNDLGEGDLLLHFGAVDGTAKVWVNGVFVGEQSEPPAKMWNKPWSLDITKALKPNTTNEIVVRVRKEDMAAGIYKPVEIRRISMR